MAVAKLSTCLLWRLSGMPERRAEDLFSSQPSGLLMQGDETFTYLL
jgi:hypothetical protein